MAKLLIVNADDLGMSEGINRGILEAHVDGIVSSTTAMVTMPAAQVGIQLAQREAPDMGIGLHFNLTYGRPLLSAKEIPSLVRSDGNFVSVSRGIVWYHHWSRRDIEAELNAQLERFIDYAGRLPDHLDSHQLIGSLSAECREAKLNIAEAHNLPVRQGGRSLFSQFEGVFASWGGLQKTLAPLLFKRYPLKRHDHIFDRLHPSPDHFEFGFHNNRATVEKLLAILDHLPEGLTELVCHPGYAGGEADGYSYRELELASLKDKRVRQKITELGIELTTFAALSETNSQHIPAIR